MIKSSINKYGLTERDMNTIRGILMKYPDITEVRLFGSRAKGNYKAGSDIDLAIMNTGVSVKTINQLAFDFQESTLPYTIDVVNFPALKHPEFIEHINRVGVTFYQGSPFLKLHV